MLGLFKRNQFFYYIFVLVYLLIISIPEFGESAETLVSESGGILYRKLIGIIGGSKPILIVTYLVISLLKMVLINVIIGDNRISSVNSLVPGVIYVLLMQMIPELGGLTEYFVANLFVLASLYNLFQAERRKHRIPKIFNVFFFLTLASMFAPLYLPLLLPLFLAVEIYLNIKVKDLWAMIIGVLTCLYMVGSLFYLTDAWEVFVHSMQGYNVLGWNFSFVDNNLAYVKIGLYAILVILVLAVKNDIEQVIHIQGRRKMLILFLLLCSSVLLYVFYSEKSLMSVAILIPWLSGLVACLLLSLKNQRLAEIVHILMIGFWVIFNFVL